VQVGESSRHDLINFRRGGHKGQLNVGISFMVSSSREEHQVKL
jgi:hypothetical protein